MKKFLLTVLVLGLAFSTIFVSCALVKTKSKLSDAEARLEVMSFVEGQDIDLGDNTGIVTIRPKGWVYYEYDSFMTDTSTYGIIVQNIFCDLHKSGLVHSFKEDLMKVYYTDKIIIKDESKNQDKIYYLVGDYYITK